MAALEAADKRAIRVAVSKGARRLDARRPNWFHDLYTPGLQLHDCHMCVCGQLYGGYDEYAVATVVGGWVYRLLRGGWDRVAKRYGFDLPESIDIDKSGAAYDYMTARWKQEVYTRRRAAKAEA